jgi:hypothetical protein
LSQLRGHQIADDGDAADHPQRRAGLALEQADDLGQLAELRWVQVDKYGPALALKA